MCDWWKFPSFKTPADRLLVFGMTLLLLVGVTGVFQGYRVQRQVLINRAEIEETRARTDLFLTDGFRDEVKARLARIEAIERNECEKRKE